MAGLSITHLNETVTQLIAQFKMNLPFLGRAFAWLWGIHFVNVLMGKRLCAFGIIPRRWFGLPGILWAPWLHVNAEHLLSNCVILLILATMIAIQGQAILLAVTTVVVIVGGFATWCLGREAVHVGASGVAMGYWGYVMVSAYHQPGLVTIAAAAVGIYYLGGLLMNLLPQGRHDSWESHFFGFLAGCLAVVVAPWLLTQAWWLHIALIFA